MGKDFDGSATHLCLLACFFFFRKASFLSRFKSEARQSFVTKDFSSSASFFLLFSSNMSEMQSVLHRDDYCSSSSYDSLFLVPSLSITFSLFLWDIAGMPSAYCICCCCCCPTRMFNNRLPDSSFARSVGFIGRTSYSRFRRNKSGTKCSKESFLFLLRNSLNLNNC